MDHQRISSLWKNYQDKVQKENLHVHVNACTKCLLLVHNLKDMYTEKIYVMISWINMNVKGNAKYSIKTRLELHEMNIRSKLHPIQKGRNLTFQQQDTHILMKISTNLYLFLKNLKVCDDLN